MEFERFEKSLREKVEKLGIELNDYQVKQFYNYMKLLIEWNKKINLTAIIDPEDIILKHFIDSLTIAKYINEKDKIADIGTGAGFPGIPIKILNPENEMLLVDSLNKRIKFLEMVIQEDKLKNIKVLHGRAEEIGRNKAYRGNFDVVTSRAVAKLNILLEYMLPLLKLGGKCICLKGPNIEEELEEARNAIKILGGQIDKIEQMELPYSDNRRNIIIIKAVKQSPNKYPRKPGTPTTSPL